jgi:hypothetical protein
MLQELYLTEPEYVQFYKLTARNKKAQDLSPSKLISRDGFMTTRYAQLEEGENKNSSRPEEN